MKVAIAVLCVVALASATSPPRPVAHGNEVPIVSYVNEVEHDGHFRYSYESGDGTKAEQSGELRVVDKDNAGVVSSGSYSYAGDDGKTYTLTYTADENGFQPHGDHLPVAPEIPAAILRALDWIAAHPSKDQH